MKEQKPSVSLVLFPLVAWLRPLLWLRPLSDQGKSQALSAGGLPTPDKAHSRKENCINLTKVIVPEEPQVIITPSQTKQKLK
uniref:Putative secreted protein n=1 Tax=Panstrongylus lignarius TaxID=156445 RepID=A0A224XSP0_9HEMI